MKHFILTLKDDIFSDIKADMQPGKTERIDITIAKGVAILLVILGHIMQGGVSEGNEWYGHFVHYLYRFHMPFFMFLSGFLFFKPGRVERLYDDYGPYLKQQTVRLFIPFLVMGIFITTAKLVAQHFVHIDKVPDNPLEGYLNLFWYTKDSPSGFLWYIVVLYLFNAICPWIFQWFKNDMRLWVLAGALIYIFVPALDYLYINQIALFFLFFAVGGAVRHHEETFLRLIRHHGGMIAVTILFLSGFVLYDYEILGKRDSMVYTGLFSIPVLYGLSRVMARYKNYVVQCFYYIGKKSYVIYLLNTLSIGATKAVIFYVTDWHYWNFLWAVPVLTTAGIVGPLVAEWLVLKRISFVKNSILRG